MYLIVGPVINLIDAVGRTEQHLDESADYAGPVESTFVRLLKKTKNIFNIICISTSYLE